MATRRQTRGGSPTIQYEDLQPKFEWTEQPAANLLNIHLPGFEKDQLKITYAHSSRKVTVTGERQVLGNLWNRFNLGFPVPPNCEVTKIQGRFQNGDLIITMPKSFITQPATKDEPKVVKEAPVPPKIASTGTTGKEGNEKIVTAPKAPEKPTTEPKAQKNLEDNFPSEKRGQEKKGRDFSPQKDQDKASEKTLSTVDTMKQKDDNNATIETPTAEAVKEKLTLEQGESSKKRKESRMIESEDISKKRKEPMVTDESLEMRKGKTDDGYANAAAAGAEKGRQDFRNVSEKVKEIRDVAAAAAKKTVRGAMEMSEEKQTMVNMGVAVLVIVAVGAYIVYNYRSSGNVQD